MESEIDTGDSSQDTFTPDLKLERLDSQRQTVDTSEMSVPWRLDRQNLSILPVGRQNCSFPQVEATGVTTSNMAPRFGVDYAPLV